MKRKLSRGDVWIGEPLQEERGLCSKRSVKRQVTKTLRAWETTSAWVDLVSPFHMSRCLSSADRSTTSCPGTVRSCLLSLVSPFASQPLRQERPPQRHGEHYHGHCRVTSFVSCVLWFHVFLCILSSCVMASLDVVRLAVASSCLRVPCFMVFSFVLISCRVCCLVSCLAS